MATRHRPSFFLLITVGRGSSRGPMSVSSSLSADMNPYPSSSSPVRSMLHTGEPHDEANSDRLLEPALFLVARLAKSLQLCSSLEVSSLLFLFWGRSRGSPCQAWNPRV